MLKLLSLDCSIRLNLRSLINDLQCSLNILHTISPRPFRILNPLSLLKIIRDRLLSLLPPEPSNFLQKRQQIHLNQRNNGILTSLYHNLRRIQRPTFNFRFLLLSFDYFSDSRYRWICPVSIYYQVYIFLLQIALIIVFILLFRSPSYCNAPMNY